MVIAGKSLGEPVDNRDSVEKLAENSILERTVADRLKDMVGFRDLLVHRYAKIDDEQAYKNFREGVKDFYIFVETAEKFLNE